MRVPRGAALTAGAGAFALVLAGGVTLAANATTAGRSADSSAPAGGAPAASGTGQAPGELVTLVTGERVRVTNIGGRASVSIDPPAPGTGAPAGRLRAASLAGREYVVSDRALPYLGRQLDRSLFDVTRPAQRLVVQWSGAARHDIPGLALAAAGDGTSTARVTSPAAFGAALADHGALDGVRTIRADGAPGGTGAPAGPPPGADPNFPMATLTVHGLDGNGAPSGSGSVAVDNVDDLQRYSNMASFDQTGVLSFSVPTGHYSIATEIGTAAADGTLGPDAVLFLPEIEVTAPTTDVTVDARNATVLVPVPQTPRPATLEQITATYGRSSASGLDSSVSYLLFGQQQKLYVAPTGPVTLGALHWYTYLRLNGPASGTDRYLYDLQFPVEGTVPSSFPTRVDATSLATVDADYHSDVPNHEIGTYRASIEPWEILPIRFASKAVAPTRRTEYVSALPDVRWASAVLWQPAETNGVDAAPWSVLQPGERRTEHPLAAPLAPGVNTTTAEDVACSACRQGDNLSLDIVPWVGGAGQMVTSLNGSDTLTVSTAVRLFANGNQVATPTAPTGTFPLPGGDADLRLELDAVKDGSWTTTSTRTSTVWQWHSRARDGALPQQRLCPDATHACAFEPLLFAGYDVAASPTNTLAAGSATTVGVVVAHQPYDPAPAADTLGFDVSTDDGKTWTPTTVRATGSGRFTTTVTPPPGSGFLSFRIRASDPDGDTLDQTVVRAVAVTG